ncbi:MAG: hypothetical protein RJA57_1365 [Bacteroidota bacterium]|jgi:iron complex outermembrane receptor protein
MKIVLLSLYIAFILPIHSFSQAVPARRSGFSIAGRITDSLSGEGLAGATVYIPEIRTGMQAGSDGRYRLAGIAPGHYVMEISHAGYNTRVEHIDLVSDREMDLRLSLVILENQGVIVTGVTGAISQRKAPFAVASVRREAFLQTAASNIIDALTMVPGVSQLTTGPAVSKPLIRGLGYNRVVVVNDGVRQEGQQWGDEHGIEIDELSVNKVEILKGPASLFYGSDALAGVVHFITQSPAPEGTVRGNLLSHYQSNNGLLAATAQVSGNRNGWNWNLYGSGKTAGDYRNRYDGRVLNSRFNERNFGGYAGINRNWGYSHLIFTRFNQSIGMVEGDRDPLGRFLLFAGSPLERVATATDLKGRDPLLPRQGIHHTRLVSDNNMAIGRNRLKFNVAWQHNRRQEYGDPEAPDDTELFFDLSTLNYSVQWQFPQQREWHSTIGMNGMRQQNRNKGEEVLIPEYRLFDVGLFVFTERQFRNTTLSGGLRFDSRSVNGDPYSEGTEVKFTELKRRFSTVSGSVGLSWEPSEKWVLKANIARGFRAPTLAELSSNGAHEGTNRYEYGVSSLRAETSLQWDAGAELNTAHVSLGLSAFYNGIEDFIFYRKLLSVGGGDSLVQVDGEDLFAFEFNQQRARLLGLEATIDLHPHPLDWLHVENSFSFVNGRFIVPVDGSRDLPLIPPARWRGEFRADIKKLGKWGRNGYVRLQAEHQFAQNRAFTGYNTETATPAYTLVHAGAGLDVTGRGKRPLFSLHLSLMNLTDVAYQNHLSRLKYADENPVTGRVGVFNMGRNFSLKLNVPLTFSR